MSRIELEAETLQIIADKLPDITNLQRTIAKLFPDFISVPFGPDSSIPDASVCLRDAVDSIWGARHALHEVYAHQLTYLEKEPSPNEFGAALFGRFYADDVALRLYAASEHLANAIVCMLEINDADLRQYQKGNRISRQGVVGKYLFAKRPKDRVLNNSISSSKINRLAQDDDL
ncbi:MAG TPA: hypothetical protein VGE04_00750 [Chloroflexia bacterium]